MMYLEETRTQTLPSDESDCLLMERVRADDDSALAVIVERHWRPLVSFSTRIVGTVDGAEEVAQESFVRLWETRKRWSPDGSVRGYLFRTARNLALTCVRHLEVRRRTEPEVRQALTNVDPSPLEAAATRELRAALLEALETLPPRRREALILVRIQQLSLEEAATRMNLARQTVANHVSLALTDLEKRLRHFGD